jgi:putative SOS response-associated peptidase YedK
MPVILDPADYALWLDERTTPEVLQHLLKPYPASQMIGYPVSRIVNSPAVDDPRCTEPV